MQYGGSTSLPYVNTDTTTFSAKPANLGPAASYGYPIDTPPRTASTDFDMPGWTAMPNPRQSGGGSAVSFAPNTARIRRPSHSLPFRRSDVVSRHLLVETALLDSQNFELLAIEEVDALKKEKAQLDSRLEATRRKLALESKVRDAAQSLHRLYTDDKSSDNHGGRGGGAAGAGPPSPTKKRLSFLGDKSGAGSQKQHVGQASDELATSQKKVDDLLQILAGMESRRQYVDSRLLRHTAAVLQLDHEEQMQAKAAVATGGSGAGEHDRNLVDNTINGFLNGGYEESIYSKDLGRNSIFMNGFGGAGRQQMDKVSAEKLVTLQSRIDGMNSQMRDLIQLVRGDAFGRDDEAEPRAPTRAGDDAVQHLETQVELVDKNLIRLEQECIKARDQRETTDAHLVETTKQLHSLLSMSDPDLPEPQPSAPLDYLDEAMLSLQSTLVTQRQQAARDLQQVRETADQYETTVNGLWDVLTSSNSEKEPFSLPGFSTRVQHVHEKMVNMDVQLDILRRQIQQQRELNSKSDSEKDKQLSDAHTARNAVEQELIALRDKHVAAEAETQGTRAEMEKVMKEVEQIRLTANANEEQKQTVLGQLNKQNVRAKELEATIATLGTQVSELQDDAKLAAAESTAKAKEHQSRLLDITKDLAEARSAHATATGHLEEKRKESEEMEAEVVRLTTELTMAKAELDGAYGSRAERAKESNTAELEELRRERSAQADSVAALMAELQTLKAGQGRTAMLEMELRDMAHDLQELARETVGAEKEREQLETVVDGLRERCETLETQLSDEKVRWLGVASPTGANGVQAEGGGAREQTSAAVLRGEFKKMMRETRAENTKLLRAEQEERKKLEAVIRGLRRENTAMKAGKAGASSS